MGAVTYSHSLATFLCSVTLPTITNSVVAVAEKEDRRRKRKQGEPGRRHHRRFEARLPLRRLRFQDHSTPSFFPRFFFISRGCSLNAVCLIAVFLSVFACC